MARLPGTTTVHTSDILDALAAHEGDHRAAAAALGVSDRTIKRRAKKEPAVAAAIVEQPTINLPKKGQGAGTLTLVTDDQIKSALMAAKSNVTEACAILGLRSPDSLRARIRKSPVLRAAFQEAREQFVDRAEAVIENAVEEGDLRAAMHVVKTLGKDRGWTERREVAQSHLHVHTAAEIPQDALEAALAERLGLDALPTSTEDLSNILEAEFTVEDAE